MKDNIEKALKKSGESIYEVRSLKIKTDKIPFLPISQLNELRRTLLEKLEKRYFSYPKELVAISI